jgi:NAD-dependent deacetylase
MDAFGRVSSVDEAIERAAALLSGARSIACLTGAGVSAESGVDTFRDAQTGLWSHFDPRMLASQDGFAEDPGLVWRWYMGRLSQVEQAQPNPGHHALANMERLMPGFTLATQNIDNLHERAGNRSVLHLHGRINAFHCNDCDSDYTLCDEDRTAALPPFCTSCGGWVRPAVVWFGEMLPERVLAHAYRAVEQCDVLLVVGTSGVVYPVASMPELAARSGATVIDVNPEPNPVSELADVYLCGPGGVILPRLFEALTETFR